MSFFFLEFITVWHSLVCYFSPPKWTSPPQGQGPWPPFPAVHTKPRRHWHTPPMAQTFPKLRGLKDTNQSRGQSRPKKFREPGDRREGRAGRRWGGARAQTWRSRGTRQQGNGTLEGRGPAEKVRVHICFSLSCWPIDSRASQRPEKQAGEKGQG